MKNIEKIQNLHWKWNGKLEPLGKMPSNKLEFIRNFVMTHPGLYCNISSESWSEDIKYLLDFRKIKKKHSSTIERITSLVIKLQ